MVPRAVLMKTGLKSVNTASPVNTVRSVNTGRPFSTVGSFNTVRPSYTAHPKSTVHCARPRTYFQNQTQSTVHMPFYKRTTLTKRCYNQRFNTGSPYEHILGTCTIKTGNLDFDDVYFVKELKFSLFSVSQMCDKKNYVLFIDSECLVLSPNFKLPDENQILLKIPRQDNMYSFDMKNIVPKDSLTCLVAKATSEESMLWHRRLGHINFKNINKLVKENLFDEKSDEGSLVGYSLKYTRVSDSIAHLLNKNKLGIVNANLEVCFIILEMLKPKTVDDSQIEDKEEPDINTGSREVSTALLEVNTATPEDLKNPKRVYQALRDPAWVEAMHEELLQFKLQKVWIIVDLPKGHRAIGTKWVYRNKKDKREIIIRNKARLVAQGHTQEEGIYYYEVRLKRSLCFSKVSHLLAVKRIFRYLKGKPSLGLWYSKDSPLELVAYTDSDYAGATQDKKSKTGGCQFLGKRPISLAMHRNNYSCLTSTY
ncbi:putative ribonuclease H-like domain-containing protein [Tanacetum coccineum]